ncbi:MAG: ribose 5-phosphate isomerase B [Firmicutes bacterium]|nr:ribose 5-phosphate isomerase B [Bacillota bacterium]
MALGSDHAGYEFKEELKGYLAGKGIPHQDLGCHSLDSVDYPDYALLVAEGVARGEYPTGILLCGTGLGMSIAANKVPGVRAAVCHDPVSARMARQHNDANVLALGMRITGPELALEIVRSWLGASFLGGRHARRVGRIREIEERYARLQVSNGNRFTGGEERTENGGTKNGGTQNG